MVLNHHFEKTIQMVVKIDLGTFQKCELVRLKAETLFHKIKMTTSQSGTR